jgi:OOP family OmpA-OmpF porin
MKTFSKLILMLILVFGVTSCASTAYLNCEPCDSQFNKMGIDVVLQEVPKSEPAPAPVVQKVEPRTLKFKEKVLFDFDSYKLDSKAMDTIMIVVSFMKHYPDTVIDIEGYTDKHGPVSYNQTLSERRANAVKNALIANGVDAYRIDRVKGFGKTRLIPNVSDHENRRAIILSIDNR